MGTTIRAPRWPSDEPGLAALDTSYVTDRVYRLHREALAFRLSLAPADPPRRTVVASLADQMPRLRAAQHVVVAEDGGAIVGLAAATEEWNRRVRVDHLYVALSARGRGVGRALMDSVVAFARARGSWCVWLETQAANYPAIRFYQRCGFRLCGLDERFYDPATTGDLAVFLALDLEPDREPPGGRGLAHARPAGERHRPDNPAPNGRTEARRRRAPGRRADEPPRGALSPPWAAVGPVRPGPGASSSAGSPVAAWPPGGRRTARTCGATPR
jgi:ribosomal protein S18 acetylase RimI-like enzyme